MRPFTQLLWTLVSVPEMKVKTLADSVHGALNCANMHQRKPNRQSLRSR